MGCAGEPDQDTDVLESYTDLYITHFSTLWARGVCFESVIALCATDGFCSNPPGLSLLLTCGILLKN